MTVITLRHRMVEAITSPAWHGAVGLTLACLSGLFVGLSLILQKKGLMMTKANNLKTGQESSHLSNSWWWCGIVSMAIGELANFGAYAFSPAILVTPLTAVSVVVAAVLSIVMLKEKMNFSGSVGIALCIIGATIIVLHSPHKTATETLDQFFKYAFAPSFIAYTAILTTGLLYLVFKVGPRYGHSNPLVYLSITAIGGAYLVNSAQGLGAAAVYSFSHWETDNQFKKWEMYPLILFVILTVLFQVHYLNRALLYFSTSIVTPLNFVFFSTATLITASVLLQGFYVSSASSAVTIICGFLVIVLGVSLLFQYNLKLLKLSTVGRVEDINDIENPELEEGPISLMKENLYPEARKVHCKTVEAEPEVYVRKMDSDQLIIPGNTKQELHAYVRNPDQTSNGKSIIPTAQPDYPLTNLVSLVSSMRPISPPKVIFPVDEPSPTNVSLASSMRPLSPPKAMPNSAEEKRDSPKSQSNSRAVTRQMQVDAEYDYSIANMDSLASSIRLVSPVKAVSNPIEEKIEGSKNQSTFAVVSLQKPVDNEVEIMSQKNDSRGEPIASTNIIGMIESDEE